MYSKFILTIFSLLLLQTTEIYKLQSGNIQFVSKAPYETIMAQSQKVAGAINVTKKTFAFSVPVTTFMGFNSELQREHFNENYMESTKYEKITYIGKISTPIDFSINGKYQVEAIGKFNIHGIENDKEIDAIVIIAGNKISIKASFSILLSNYNISIPSVVKDKLSNQIDVQFEGTFLPKV